MTLHLHHLEGCRPEPLAHYLKALGVFRLVGEQADPEVYGFFRDEHFCLVTKLDRARLEAFFLERYAPTPFVSPWNKGSGFLDKNTEPLLALERTTAPRFAPFREGVRAGRAPANALREADAAIRAVKAKTKGNEAARAMRNDPVYKAELAAADRRFKKLKASIYQPFLLSFRGPHREWLDAALVTNEQGKPTWPSLLGSGGNDGNLDFTNNAMQWLGKLFDLASPDGGPRPGAESRLALALYGDARAVLDLAPIGQFLPGGAGGANASTGPDGPALVNGWDFLLMLEGAVLFQARTSRRLDPNAAQRAAAPFAVRPHGAGSTTRGLEKAQRGEQWMPLWSEPATLPSIKAMLGEARMHIDRNVAHQPLDVARAIARLGVGVVRRHACAILP